MKLTDKELVRERFEANFSRYNRLALVQQRICSELLRDVDAYCRGPVKKALEVGVGTGFLTSGLMLRYPGAEWFLNDIAPAAERYVAKYAAGANHTYLWGDAEETEFPEGLDMVASASTVQWFDDLPAFMIKASAATQPGGYLVLSTFGKENFREIKAASGEGLEYYTAEELGEMARGSGYEILNREEYIETLRFDTPADVLHHIKATGVNSLRKEPWTRGRLAEFSRTYMEFFPDPEGGVRLTYHPILMIARRS